MEDLVLLFPTLDMKEKALAYRQEYFDCGESEIHGDGGLDHAENYESWLEKITSAQTAAQTSWVNCSTYFAVVVNIACNNIDSNDIADNKIVGTIQIRHTLNDFLLKYGGHIGYGVLPSERRKGYAARMLALALEKCRELGIEKALVTCDKDNIGSAKTILKNGGILENEIAREDGKITQRYWIDV